jgi:hypothetical protein
MPKSRGKSSTSRRVTSEKPWMAKGTSKYGAAMGRRSDPEAFFTGLVRLEQVPLTDGGDYDEGGAYWGGGGSPLYCAWDDDGHVVYLRAKSLEAAKRELPPSWLYVEEHRDGIIRGMAAMLWALAWADHAEEHGCSSLSGDIMAMMPSVPKMALKEAEKVAKGIEKANHVTLDELFSVACLADGRQTSDVDPENFGGDLAHMSIGTGVSWFDDHSKFPLQMPYGSNDDLRMHADDTCQDEGSSD